VAAGDGLDACIEKMRAAGLAEVAIATFAGYYRMLEAGDTGLIPESEIEPVSELPDAADLTAEASSELLDQTVVIKLNGGLGTSMGMTKAKSLIEAKDGNTFLDLIARQVQTWRARSGARMPLVLMNSFSTQADSLAALATYPGVSADLPPDFLQGKEPKVRVDDLRPVEWPANTELEWCPPGHGDIYTALQSSGLLDAMLERGYRWAFVSNSDNLGATIDARILAWIAAENAPFLMEVCDRTEADRKGGHIARWRAAGRDGLMLRETAQTPDEDIAALQDISRHRFLNTNNLWIDLRVLSTELDRRDGVLGLPLIRNRKTVDPSDPSSPEVFQIETAMGAALGVIDGARAIRVPRHRFAPVKTTNDLLLLRSDAYALGPDADVEPVAEAVPFVDLDSRFFRLVGDFEPRVARGVPSLRACRRLTVRGDVSFGPGVEVRGEVEIDAGDGALVVEDTVLE
jgi:UTP--glucose-1-phosphate uridylyltransferase